MVKGITVMRAGIRSNSNTRNRIYAIVTKEEPRYVKFGVSIDPDKRLRIMAGNCPLFMDCVGSVRGTYKEEALLLRALRDHHIHGEWFRGEDAAKVAADMIHDGDVKGLGRLISEQLRKIKYQSRKTYYQRMEEKICAINGTEP